MSAASGLSLSGNLRREARIIGLLFASTTSMIGSGWLFGSYHAARIAGPYAIWSWVVGAVIIMLIALCFAELGVLFPRSGALVHMSHASHGDGLGRIWGWMDGVSATEESAHWAVGITPTPRDVRRCSPGRLNGPGHAG
jgi:amino acid transporter